MCFLEDGKGRREGGVDLVYIYTLALAPTTEDSYSDQIHVSSFNTRVFRKRQALYELFEFCFLIKTQQCFIFIRKSVVHFR